MSRPVQNHKIQCIPDDMYLKAYEVYAAIYGEQQSLLEGSCRGGFGVGELLVFLYLRNFPRVEWRKRVNQAFEEMNAGFIKEV